MGALATWDRRSSGKRKVGRYATGIKNNQQANRIGLITMSSGVTHKSLDFSTFPLLFPKPRAQNSSKILCPKEARSARLVKASKLTCRVSQKKNQRNGWGNEYPIAVSMASPGRDLASGVAGFLQGHRFVL